MRSVRIGCVIVIITQIFTVNALADATVKEVIDKKITTNYGQHKDVSIFIRELNERDAFTLKELQAWFASANKQQSIIDAISRPAEKTLSWEEYRQRFVSRNRIEKGIEFWKQHRTDLQRAEQTLGVPAEIIVAIIGVETNYGQRQGNHRVIDALSTLAFDYPPRSSFFRKELREFLLLSREQQLDPLKPMGSYAGAMGYGQFMPSSYRAYAIDFDRNGTVDIWGSTADAIGSVANYFKVHGWRKGEPVVVRSRVSSDYNQAIVNQSLKPQETIDKLRSQGFIPVTAIAGQQLATAMRLEGSQGPEFWLGLYNFYVITRYNSSKLYAMAVWQLSQSIAQEQPKME
jgi:membrane-bound lytic murein transglycosylase B